MTVCVATTLTTFAMEDEDTWGAWLINAEAIADSHPTSFFAAIETDGRGLGPFWPLISSLNKLGGTYWDYHLGNYRQVIHTENRLIPLTLGQTIATDYATVVGATHMLFVAADCEPPPDVLPKLLEMDVPLCGAEIPTYCLDGPTVPEFRYPVQEQLISAACIMIRRDVFKRLRWRVDADIGFSDDPCYQLDAKELLGVRSLVRKDCVATHHPTSIGPIESRFPGRDMKVYQ